MNQRAREPETAEALMQAAVVTGPGRDEIKRWLSPSGARQVRIRLEGCGVCASNLVPWSARTGCSFRPSPAGSAMKAGA